MILKFTEVICSRYQHVGSKVWESILAPCVKRIVVVVGDPVVAIFTKATRPGFICIYVGA